MGLGVAAMASEAPATTATAVSTVVAAYITLLPMYPHAYITLLPYGQHCRYELVRIRLSLPTVGLIVAPGIT